MENSNGQNSKDTKTPLGENKNILLAAPASTPPSVEIEASIPADVVKAHMGPKPTKPACPIL